MNDQLLTPRQNKKHKLIISRIPSGVLQTNSDIKDVVGVNLREAEEQYELKIDTFKKISGYIHDIGAPNADFGFTVVLHGNGSFTFKLLFESHEAVLEYYIQDPNVQFIKT